jgi:hypothetical protein
MKTILCILAVLVLTTSAADAQPYYSGGYGPGSYGYPYSHGGYPYSYSGYPYSYGGATGRYYAGNYGAYAYGGYPYGYYPGTPWGGPVLFPRYYGRGW